MVLTVAGSLLTITWLHATKNKLIDKTVSQNEIRNITLESIITPMVFLLSILVSFINLQIAHYFWLVLIPAKIISRKRK